MQSSDVGTHLGTPAGTACVFGRSESSQDLSPNSVSSLLFHFAPGSYSYGGLSYINLLPKQFLNMKLFQTWCKGIPLGVFNCVFCEFASGITADVHQSLNPAMPPNLLV